MIHLHSDLYPTIIVDDKRDVSQTHMWTDIKFAFGSLH